MPAAHHTFHEERQTNAHDITHDATGMPIAPGVGPLIMRPDGQRLEVSPVQDYDPPSARVSHLFRFTACGQRLKCVLLAP